MTATRLTQNSELSTRWNASDCSTRTSVRVNSTNQDLPFTFSDNTLEKLLSQKEAGLIYIFSEGMHLSLEGLKDVTDLARQLKINITLLSESILKSGANIQVNNTNVETLVLDSFDLEMRGVRQHYPSLIIYSKRGEFSNVFPGRKSKSEYQQFIEGFLR